MVFFETITKVGVNFESEMNEFKIVENIVDCIKPIPLVGIFVEPYEFASHNSDVTRRRSGLNTTERECK